MRNSPLVLDAGLPGNYTVFMPKETKGRALPAGSALLHIGTEISADLAPDFDRWCEEDLRSNLGLPGFVAARRFVRDEVWPGSGHCPQYLTLYDLQDPSALDSQAYASHDQSIPDPYRSQISIERSVYREIGELPQNQTQATGTAILHVTVDVEPAFTDEFLAWYAEVHVPAVLDAPGMIAARRFENALLAESPVLPEGQHTYCTLYEMEDEGVIGRPETLASSSRGACPTHLESRRIAANRVYTEIFRSGSDSSGGVQRADVRGG